MKTNAELAHEAWLLHCARRAAAYERKMADKAARKAARAAKAAK